MGPSANEPTRLIDKVRPLLPRVGSPLAYGAAAILVAVGAALRFPLDALTREPLPPFITLYPAIVAAAFAGGARAGVFAMLLSLIAAWLLWLAPTPDVPLVERAALCAIYVLAATFTVMVSGLARQLLDEAASGEAQRDRVARESVHRIKNLLAVVQAISRKIAKSADNVEEYHARLAERLHALACTQELLLKRDGHALPLDEFVSATLKPFLPNPRFVVDIEPGLTTPISAIPLSMALFELATNSMKYGGLAGAAGSVQLQARAMGAQIRVRWQETGLLNRADTGREGLGVRVVRAALSEVCGGHVDYVLANDQVICVFAWPLKRS